MGPVFLSQAKWISLNLLIIEISLGFFFFQRDKMGFLKRKLIESYAELCKYYIGKQRNHEITTRQMPEIQLKKYFIR